MAITIEDPEVEQLARRLAAEQGVSVDRVIGEALRARTLGRAEPPPADLPEPAAAAAREREAAAFLEQWYARLPTLPTRDDRPGDEILYDEFGLPR